MSTTMLGGAETNVLKISEDLVENGYEVHFATLENSGSMFKLSKSVSSYTTIGLYNKTPVKSIRSYRELLKQDFDFVLNFGLRVEVFSRILTWFFSSRTKIISNIRTTDSFRSNIQIWLDRLTARFVYQWISNSEAGKRAFVLREKVKEDKIKVIYNYIDIIDDKVVTDKVESETLVIGILANIREKKGHYDLIPLANILIKNGIFPEFICAGEDNTNGDFIEKIKSNKLEKYFKFPGFISNKSDFFNSIDIFLLPSYMEGMPTSILESMNFGVPVISTNIDGIPEQIRDGYNGFLLTPGDSEGFGVAIKRLNEDSELRSDFISRSRKLIRERFTKEVNLELWKQSLT